MDLLSDTILSANIVSDEAGIREATFEIARLHYKMKHTIEEVASDLERGAYKAAEEAVNNMRLDDKELERAQRLLKADNEFVVSLQTLSIAMQVIQRLNEDIRNRLDEIEGGGTPDPTKQRDLLLTNALLAYEATDFLIEYIENFRIRGVGVINRIHNEAIADLESWKHGIKALKREAEDPNSRALEEVRRAVLTDAEAQENAIDNAIEEWDRVRQRHEEAKEAVDSANGQLDTLKLIRQHAERQISMLGAAAVLQLARQNMRLSLETYKSFKTIRIESLSAERIRRLLAILR
jgi:hypothetical protein